MTMAIHMGAMYSLTQVAQHHPNIHDHNDHSGEGHSNNMHGVFFADTVGSVGVITSTLLIRYYGWTGFDPMASLFTNMLIAASV